MINKMALMSLIRAVIKIGSGWAIAKGLGDENSWEAAGGAAAALGATMWGMANRQRLPAKVKVPLCLVAVGLAFVTGCVSVQDRAGKYLASTAITVDAAMRGYAAWVALHPGPPSPEQATVRAAYMNYQATMMIATNAYAAAVLSKDWSGWDGASNQLFVAKTALISNTPTH